MGQSLPSLSNRLPAGTSCIADRFCAHAMQRTLLVAHALCRSRRHRPTPLTTHTARRTRRSNRSPLAARGASHAARHARRSQGSIAAAHAVHHTRPSPHTPLAAHNGRRARSAPFVPADLPARHSLPSTNPPTAAVGIGAWQWRLGSLHGCKRRRRHGRMEAAAAACTYDGRCGMGAWR